VAGDADDLVEVVQYKRDLYKKHHWLVAGAGEQTELVDALAERIQTQQTWFLAEHVIDVPLVRA
jgi:hypothetical protein